MKTTKRIGVFGFCPVYPAKLASGYADVLSRTLTRGGRGAVDFTYETTDLRALCLRKQAAVKAFGDAAAAALFARLADIAACQSLAELFELLPENLAVCDDVVTMRVQAELLLRFQPGHVKPRRLGNGEPDWSEIARVRIIFVGANIA